MFRFLTLIPKGPFRTKDTTALESVVFCNRHFSVSVLCSCLFFPRKPSISEHSPKRFATSVANLLPVPNSHSVVFLVREGPLRFLDFYRTRRFVVRQEPSNCGNAIT